jgi:hypothetical protein
MRQAGAEAEREGRLITPMETMMAVRIGLFEEPPEEARATTLGLLLNLLNVFLYMTNYNLVIPFADKFCDHLGASRSIGGVVIGCADVMAIVVSVGYSVWTNHSFKQPLIFASVICLAGNVLVTLAYDGGGLPLLLAGRLLTGTGASRALNRRYIADFVTLEGRTTASIGFVAASAAGMALGPFMAVPLTAAMERYGDRLHVMGLTLNAITISGWLMVVAWGVFAIVAVLFFEEPLPSPEARGAAPEASNELTEELLSQQHYHPSASAALSPMHNSSRKHASQAVASCDGIGDAKAPDWSTSLDHGAEPVAIDVPRAAPDGGEEDEAGVKDADEVLSAQPISSPRLSQSGHLGSHLARAAAVLVNCMAGPYMLPTIACIVFLFLLKLLQQGAVSSAPLLTESFYGWSESTVGLFMAAMSMAMLPVNFSVAAMTAVVRPACICTHQGHALAMTDVHDAVCEHRAPCCAPDMIHNVVGADSVAHDIGC